MTGQSKDAERKPASPVKDKNPVKTDGAVEGEMKPLKRPVNSDGFLIDRPLSPEEEGLAGPLPDRDGAPDQPQRK